jgi:hypothetical protein
LAKLGLQEQLHTQPFVAFGKSKPAGTPTKNQCIVEIGINMISNKLAKNTNLLCLETDNLSRALHGNRKSMQHVCDSLQLQADGAW